MSLANSGILSMIVKKNQKKRRRSSRTLQVGGEASVAHLLFEALK